MHDYDCTISDAQQWLELFFSTSLVRGIKRRANETADAFAHGDVAGGFAGLYNMFHDPLHTNRHQNALNYLQRGDVPGALVVAADPTGLSDNAINLVHNPRENAEADLRDTVHRIGDHFVSEGLTIHSVEASANEIAQLTNRAAHSIAAAATTAAEQSAELRRQYLRQGARLLRNSWELVKPGAISTYTVSQSIGNIAGNTTKAVLGFDPFCIGC